MGEARGPGPEHLLGSLEASVMEDVWVHGESSVGEVLERLNSDRRRPLAYNTVMSVMARLADKKLLRRHRQGRAYRYEAAMTRDEFVQDRATRAAVDMLSDYGDLAVAGFVNSVRENPDLQAKLMKLLEQAVEGGDGGKGST